MNWFEKVIRKWGRFKITLWIHAFQDEKTHDQDRYTFRWIKKMTRLGIDTKE